MATYVLAIVGTVVGGIRVQDLGHGGRQDQGAARGEDDEEGAEGPHLDDCGKNRWDRTEKIVGLRREW